jgi:hypothetical protein
MRLLYFPLYDRLHGETEVWSGNPRAGRLNGGTSGGSFGFAPPVADTTAGKGSVSTALVVHDGGSLVPQLKNLSPEQEEYLKERGVELLHLGPGEGVIAYCKEYSEEEQVRPEDLVLLAK